MEYRFGFNDQDQDGELGDYYAFEYRIHDTRLGRFLSMDQLAPKYPWNSTYAFAENTVIWAIELEGLEAAPISGMVAFQPSLNYSFSSTPMKFNRQTTTYTSPYWYPDATPGPMQVIKDKEARKR